MGDMIVGKLKSFNVAAQSYKTIDMILLNLRTAISKATSDQKKAQVIDEFYENNPNKDFYQIEVSPPAENLAAKVIDKEIRRLQAGLITADIVSESRNDPKFVTGGYFYGHTSFPKNVDQQKLKVTKADLRDPTMRDKFMASLNTVMKAKSIGI